jgi:hypothetical protein
MTERIPATNEYADVIKEIQQMVEKDQESRSTELAELGQTISITEEDANLDRIHADRMREIITKIGWPTISKVGVSCSHMAWLLVQHADHDVEFQKCCLDLMKQAPQGEVNLEDIAYLEDRVRVNEERPQLYGTQFHGEGSEYGPRPIEDPEQVDERRKSIGMESLEEYKKFLKEKYNIK